METEQEVMQHFEEIEMQVQVSDLSLKVDLHKKERLCTGPAGGAQKQRRPCGLQRNCVISDIAH